MSQPYFLRGSDSPIFSVGEVLDRASCLFEPFGDIEKTEIEKVARYSRKKLKKLQSAANQGKIETTRLRQEWLFKSDAAKLVSLILCKPKWRTKLSLFEAKRLSCKIDVRRPPDGFVRVYKKVKKNGDYRIIANPSPEIRMQQQLVLLISKMQWGNSNYDWAYKGRGRDAAVHNTTSEITEGGARWFVETDIKECFDSYDKSALEQLIPLPKSVVRHSVTLCDDIPIISKDNDLASKKAVRSGLVQGLQCSSYFSAKLLEPELAKISDGHVRSYVDNILVTSNSENDALAIKDALVYVLNAIQVYAAEKCFYEFWADKDGL